MNHSIFMSILVSFLTSYCIRVLPLTLIRKLCSIRNTRSHDISRNGTGNKFTNCWHCIFMRRDCTCIF